MIQTLMKQATPFDLPLYDDYIGVVYVNGTIADTESTFGMESYNHKQTLELIDAYKNSSNNKAILLRVNSPGGSVYASDDIYLKLMEYKEVTKRPVITYMEDMAASGGYYIAMASDKIYANRNTTTGSIGVIMSLINYEEAAKKLGIKATNITSGSNKDLGSPWKALDIEQAKILQDIVDEAYEQFVEIISAGRNMPKDKLYPLADGRIYTAKQALEENLIDEIAVYDDVVSILEEEYGGKLFEYKASAFSFSSFFNYKAITKSKTDVEILMEMINDNRNGVLMYYAN